MSKKGCLDIERVGDVLDLAEDDPLRRHADSCPRCSALVLSYREFVTANPVPGADPDDAGARLSAFLESRIAVEEAGSASKQKGFLEMFSGVFRPRPALAAAAVVLLVATTALVMWRPWQPDPTPVLRGPVGPPPLELQAPEVLDGASLRLHWQPVEGADSYEVRFYTTALSEIARIGPIRETTLVFKTSQAYPKAQKGSSVLWRVIAYSGGNQVAVSPGGWLVLP